MNKYEPICSFAVNEKAKFSKNYFKKNVNCEELKLYLNNNYSYEDISDFKNILYTYLKTQDNYIDYNYLKTLSKNFGKNKQYFIIIDYFLNNEYDMYEIIVNNINLIKESRNVFLDYKFIFTYDYIIYNEFLSKWFYDKYVINLDTANIKDNYKTEDTINFIKKTYDNFNVNIFMQLEYLDANILKKNDLYAILINNDMQIQSSINFNYILIAEYLKNVFRNNYEFYDKDNSDLFKYFYNNNIIYLSVDINQVKNKIIDIPEIKEKEVIKKEDNEILTELKETDKKVKSDIFYEKKQFNYRYCYNPEIDYAIKNENSPNIINNIAIYILQVKKEINYLENVKFTFSKRYTNIAPAKFTTQHLLYLDYSKDINGNFNFDNYIYYQNFRSFLFSFLDMMVKHTYNMNLLSSNDVKNYYKEFILLDVSVFNFNHGIYKFRINKPKDKRILFYYDKYIEKLGYFYKYFLINKEKDMKNNITINKDMEVDTDKEITIELISSYCKKK